MLRPATQNETSAPYVPLWDLKDPASKLLLWRGRAATEAGARQAAIEQARYANHELFPPSLADRLCALRVAAVGRAKDVPR